MTPRVSAERLKGIEREAEKKAIETARYVIPIGAFTSMVHTISGITLHRLRRMSAAGDTPHEASLVIGRMVDLVREIDPLFFEKVGCEELAASDLPESAISAPARQRRRVRPRVRHTARRPGLAVDRQLAGCPEGSIAEAVRVTFGLTADEMPDEEALDRVLNPARNRYRLDVMNVSYHSPMMRGLHHASYTFAKRLSHTADSQDQRHRMVPASRPLMTFADTAAPDYVVPRLIAANAQALAVYRAARCRTHGARRTGCSSSACRSSSRCTCCRTRRRCGWWSRARSSRFLHKWTLRTCFNAQEEIYLASMDEVAQVREKHPQLARYVGPPCVVRNGLISPRCTEGTHFCGVPVWRSFPDVVRRL